MMRAMRRYLRFVGRHQLAVSAIAAACGVIIVLLHPDQIGAWIIGVLGAAWLGRIIIVRRRGAS
jgi:hypothetical protein